MFPIFILPAKACHKHHWHIFPFECVFFFPDIPFIKPGSRNHDTSVQNAVPEHGFSGADSHLALKISFFPGNRKSPALPPTAYETVLSPQDRGILPRIDVSDRNSVHCPLRIPAFSFRPSAKPASQSPRRFIIHIISSTHKIPLNTFFSILLLILPYLNQSNTFCSYILMA